MRKLWSNSRKRTQDNEKRKGEDSSYSQSIEVLLRETARRGYPDPEEVDNPMVTPQDYDVRFVNPDEFWSSKTEIFGYDEEICAGIFTYHS